MKDIYNQLLKAGAPRLPRTFAYRVIRDDQYGTVVHLLKMDNMGRMREIGYHPIQSHDIFDTVEEIAYACRSLVQMYLKKVAADKKAVAVKDYFGDHSPLDTD